MHLEVKIFNAVEMFIGLNIYIYIYINTGNKSTKSKHLLTVILYVDAMLLEHIINIYMYILENINQQISNKTK